MNVSCENINCPYISICDIRVSNDKEGICAYAKSFIDRTDKEQEVKEKDGKF